MGAADAVARRHLGVSGDQIILSPVTRIEKQSQLSLIEAMAKLPDTLFHSSLREVPALDYIEANLAESLRYISGVIGRIG